MERVDRSGQMLTSYEVEWKLVKKWYKKQFIHLINVAILNSHILHKKKKDHLEDVLWKL